MAAINLTSIGIAQMVIELYNDITEALRERTE